MEIVIIDLQEKLVRKLWKSNNGYAAISISQLKSELIWKGTDDELVEEVKQELEIYWLCAKVGEWGISNVGSGYIFLKRIYTPNELCSK